jgi:hypothetical protein
MNPAIEELLTIVETDPLPEAHTSSHWRLYGRKTVVQRHGDELVLRGYGFGSMEGHGLPWQAAQTIERWSYLRVTSRLTSYPSVWKAAKRLARDLSFDLTFDVWRQSVALAVLVDHWAEYNLHPKTFAMIGDGYGFFGALVRKWVPYPTVYCIDLPKMLVFQAHTHELADGAATMSLLSNNGGQADVVLSMPQDIGLISTHIDCAINIASMQEMTNSSIASYFAFLRQRSTPESRFYCVNRLRKELPGGEVTSFQDYPWQEDDEVFIDGPCPYYTHFLASHTLAKGPKLWGIRVPFVNYFDGIQMHRLERLAPG